MSPLTALVLASLVVIDPPILTTPPSIEATYAGDHVTPAIDADAVARFVVETSARYTFQK